jgi:Protein of unknown function (DUF726)
MELQDLSHRRLFLQMVEGVAKLGDPGYYLSSLTECDRMRIATWFLTKLLSKLSSTEDSKKREYLLVEIPRFLPILWSKILWLDSKSQEALNQMLSFHIETARELYDLDNAPSVLQEFGNVRDLIIAVIEQELYFPLIRYLFLEINPEYISMKVLILEQLIASQLLPGSADSSVSSPAYSSSSSSRRKWRIAAGVAAGGFAMALSGGLAAPFIAAGVSTLGASLSVLGPLGTAVGSILASSTVLVSSSASAAFLFGSTGAGVAGWKLNKRLSDLKEFEFDVLSSSPSIELTMFISGFLLEPTKNNPSENEFLTHWKCVNESMTSNTECFVLRWESDVLRNVGNVLFKLIKDEISKSIASFYISATIGASGMWPVWVMNAVTDLDNTWLVGKEKANIAAEQLASLIIAKSSAGRPLTLIGFSMGAKLIFETLQILYEENHFGSIGDCILLGAPVSTTFNAPVGGRKEKWLRARSVVNGSFINGYSESDWLLGILSRYVEWGIHVAGLSPVQLPGITDVDLKGIVNVHTDYPVKMNLILSHLGFIKK